MGLATIGTLIGGLGLLLVGMGLMTDGLKLAAGNALRDILALWTNTRLRGLFSGFLITGVVQSSGAVTVATIGFANAGMLTLERALWVIFGSNIGTTMTAWIVALIGFRLNIEAFALPLIGIGAILKLTGSNSQRASLGLALVGFGMLFLGIGVLQGTFEDLSASYTLPAFSSFGLTAVVMYVLIGFMLTTAMQSSSASMVLALGAAESGLLPLNAAAAVIIGANLGSTTMAVISVFGATSVAKRVALGHVTFNVLTAAVAILILGPLLWLITGIQSLLGLATAPATTLAVFHSVFNVLGVLLMWPISGRLAAFLAGCFTSREETESLPRHLDKNVLSLPYIAADSLALEVGRVSDHTIRYLQLNLAKHADHKEVAHEAAIVRNLSRAVGTYSSELNRSSLTPLLVEVIANLIESTQQYLLVLDIGEDLAEINRHKRLQRMPADLAAAIDTYVEGVRHYLDGLNLADTETGAGHATDYTQVETDYRLMKDKILQDAASGLISMEEMDMYLQFGNQVKRACRQLWKATRRLASVQDALRRDASGMVTMTEGVQTEKDSLEILQEAKKEIAEENHNAAEEAAAVKEEALI